MYKTGKEEKLVLYISEHSTGYVKWMRSVNGEQVKIQEVNHDKVLPWKTVKNYRKSKSG